MSSNKVMKDDNDLASVNPILAKEWHSTKNGKIKPIEVSSGSSKKIWWLGTCGHEWQASVHHRNKNKSGCPFCSGNKVLKGFNDLATTNPKLVQEWHPNKNENITPNSITSGSSKKVWWKCELGHEWEATISHRNKGSKCPVCANQKILKGFNDLGTTNPELAKEWNPTKNKNLTAEMITHKSGKKVWWQCSDNHEWQATVSDRTRGEDVRFARIEKS